MPGFINMLRKKKELIPLVGIMVFAAAGGLTSCIYALMTKTDIILNKTNNPEPWENINPSKPQKLLTFHQEWKPVEELELVKKITKSNFFHMPRLNDCLVLWTPHQSVGIISAQTRVSEDQCAEMLLPPWWGLSMFTSVQ